MATGSRMHTHTCNTYTWPVTDPAFPLPPPPHAGDMALGYDLAAAQLTGLDFDAFMNKVRPRGQAETLSNLRGGQYEAAAEAATCETETTTKV